eukprot:68678_1
MEFNFVNVSRGRHDYPRQSIIGYAIDTYGVAGDVHIGSIANNEYLNFYNPGNNDCWSSARVNFYNSTMNFGKIKFSANFRGLYIRNFTWIFAEPATSEPTIYPSIMPSSDPTTSPTRSYKTKIVNGSYICGDLTASKYVEYDVTFEECVNMHCGDNVNDCAMVNYIPNSKSSTDSRCYVFDKQCEIYNGNGDTFIAVRGFDSFCVDFPYDWTDKFRDTCYHYVEYEWCVNGTINIANVSVQDIIDETDFKYNLNANEVCCECGGGVTMIEDEVMVTFHGSASNISNNLLCEWKYGSETWRQYNNLELYDLCMKLKEKVYRNYIFIQDEQLLNEHIDDIDCDIFINKGYPSNVDINSCENYVTQDGLYFMNLFAIDVTSVNLFVNADWFNISSDLISTNVEIRRMEYSQCLSMLESVPATYHYGIFPCDVEITSSHPTLQPTLSPTYLPTVNPSLYPTINPTSFPTINPTSVPTINPTSVPTINPTSFPTINPTSFPTINPT